MPIVTSLIGAVVNATAAYTPTYAQDVVAVFDASFNQIFVNARPVKASVKESAKLMKHPVESGSTQVDHRVFEPIGIDLSMVLTPANYFDTYREIRGVFLGKSTIQVQTKTGLYQNLLISDMPHEESPDTFDTIKMTIKLSEVIIVSASTITTATSKQNGGNKTGSAATATQENNANAKANSGSALHSILYGKGGD